MVPESDQKQPEYRARCKLSNMAYHLEGHGFRSGDCPPKPDQVGKRSGSMMPRVQVRVTDTNSTELYSSSNSRLSISFSSQLPACKSAVAPGLLEPGTPGGRTRIVGYRGLDRRSPSVFSLLHSRPCDARQRPGGAPWTLETCFCKFSRRISPDGLGGGCILAPSASPPLARRVDRLHHRRREANSPWPFPPVWVDQANESDDDERGQRRRRQAQLQAKVPDTRPRSRV